MQTGTTAASVADPTEVSWTRPSAFWDLGERGGGGGGGSGCGGDEVGELGVVVVGIVRVAARCQPVLDLCLRSVGGEADGSLQSALAEVVIEVGGAGSVILFSIFGTARSFVRTAASAVLGIPDLFVVTLLEVHAHALALIRVEHLVGAALARIPVTDGPAGQVALHLHTGEPFPTHAQGSRVQVTGP